MIEHSDAEFTPEERAQVRKMLAHMSFPDDASVGGGDGDDGGNVRLQPGRPRGEGRSGTVVVEHAGSSTPALVFSSRETGREVAVHVGDQDPDEAGISEAREGTLYVRLGPGPARVYTRCGRAWLLPG